MRTEVHGTICYQEHVIYHTQIYDGNKKTGTYFMGVDLRSSEEDLDFDL